MSIWNRLGKVINSGVFNADSVAVDTTQKSFQPSSEMLEMPQVPEMVADPVLLQHQIDTIRCRIEQLRCDEITVGAIALRHHENALQWAARAKIIDSDDDPLFVEQAMHQVEVEQKQSDKFSHHCEQLRCERHSLCGQLDKLRSHLTQHAAQHATQPQDGKGFEQIKDSEHQKDFNDSDPLTSTINRDSKQSSSSSALSESV